MLDTVVLSLPPHDFTILDHDAFTPSSRGLLVQPYYPLRRGGMACINNPDKSATERYGYMPRLTLSKRPATAGFRVALRIDASLPKLKFGNNFDELTDADLPFLCERLAQQMRAMGVRVTPEAIRRAEVSAIHYSKNLPLTDHTRCSMVIREIAKGSITRQLDSVKTDYRNDGSAIRFHATAHEVIVYDKLKDLERARVSDKRSYESDNQGQLDLLHVGFAKPFEVLRLEARLNNRRKLKTLLDRLGTPCPLTLESLYSEALAKTVLLDYWRMITPDVPLLALSHFAAGELYDAIRRENPDAKPGKALQLVGALAIVQKEGMEGLRVRVEQSANPRTWGRLKASLQGISVSSHMKYNALRVAEGHLRRFEPLRLADYQVEQKKAGGGNSGKKMAGVDMTLLRGTDATNPALPAKYKGNAL